MTAEQKERFLDAALTHVLFDGWSEDTMRAAAADLGISRDAARGLFPRGPVELAAAYHRRLDGLIAEAAQEESLATLRYSEKVSELVFRRVNGSDREIVRRGMALFALPTHAVEGAALVWGTADAIWNALGDTSRDGNWYSKRAILSGVISSSVLFWLGDGSADAAGTRAFVERRIDDVMRFERFKGRMRDNPATRPLMALQDRLFGVMRAPDPTKRSSYPGHISGKAG